MFGRERTPPSRHELIAAGDRARVKGKTKKAIAEYRRVLEGNPDDFEVHGKLAPLLAATKRPKEAVESFRKCAEGHAQRGFADRAIAVYVQAATMFPKQIELWEKAARLHYERGRRADAVKILWQGSKHFRKKTRLAQAAAMLESAASIDPQNVALALDLSGVLKKLGKRDEALRVLEFRVERATDDERRSIRRAQFRLEPSFKRLWRWWRNPR